MTEEISQKFEGLDTWPAEDTVNAMFDGQLDAINSIKPALKAIANAAEAASKRLGKTGRLFYVGAGTSGRLAVLDGSELGPTYSWPNSRLEFCMAGGSEALTHSQEGAEDIPEDGKAYIENAKAGPKDVVICVAASGGNPFTLGALRAAKKRGAMTIGIVNNPDTPILTESDHPILAQTGGEIVAGSTRMKAGTAQKAILNMLSTAIMIRLGRVYDGLMVDMIVSNIKLEQRAVNMVKQIAECSEDAARTALGETRNNIKQAVLVCAGASTGYSAKLLEQTDGNLRQALAELKLQE